MDPRQLLLILLVVVCALAAVSTGHGVPGRGLTGYRRPAARRAVLERPLAQRGPSARKPLSLEAARRREARAFEQVRQDIKRGAELKAVLALDSWGGEPDGFSPLSREQCQLLLSEAVRAGYLPSVLRQLGAKLESAGIALDWAGDVDKMGRFALDSVLDVAVNEVRSESSAMALLDMGVQSGSGSTARLNSNPLLRAAAMHGMTRFAEKLVLEGGADVNSKDPRYGRTALDVALEAQRQSTATRLVELGARPAASGRGIEWLLRNANPTLRNMLARLPLEPSAAAPGPAGDGSSTGSERVGSKRAEVKAAYDAVLRCLQSGDTPGAATSLDRLLSDVGTDAEGQWLSVMDFQRLLEEGARRTAPWPFLKRVASRLEGLAGRLDWPADVDVSAGYGQYPLDAALRAAVMERGNEDIALEILDLGLRSSEGSVTRLNPNPLLRAAAAKGMTTLLERLVVDGAADVDAADPQYGGVALDRAVEAGAHQAALTLLELGADPEAGKGPIHLMQRASPAVAARIREAALGN